MKSRLITLLTLAVIVMVLAVPASAKTNTGTTGPTADVVVDRVNAILADWYENWDSYPTGQNMHGVGGWKGWYNDPNATAYTTDAQFISSPNSIDINGLSDLVHEYTIDSGVWTYTAWQYIPAGFADESYFILLNQYDDGGVTTNWSTQVRFDGNDGIAVFQGYYQDFDSLPLITGQWVEIRVEIDLEADWQQIYYGGDLLYETNWSNGTGSPTPGITSIGAVDLFANASAPVYYDDLSLVEAGGPDTIHVEAIDGFFILDYMGRPILRAHAWVADSGGMMMSDVLVDVSIWVPDGGPHMRSRYTKPSGAANFHWGSWTYGTWTLCVDNLTLAGYTYNPDENVVTCVDWDY